jgi:hypothetical protein
VREKEAYQAKGRRSQVEGTEAHKGRERVRSWELGVHNKRQSEFRVQRLGIRLPR